MKRRFFTAKDTTTGVGRYSGFPKRYVAILAGGCVWQMIGIGLVLSVVVAAAQGQPADADDGLMFTNKGDATSCLAQDIKPNSTVESDIDLLNCLITRVPDDFWDDASSLRRCIDGSGVTGYGENACGRLHYGNWRCSFVPVRAGLPPCVRHDVAYASLQQFVGDGGFHELDETWNPRNKHLADAIFKGDLDRESTADGESHWLLGNGMAKSLLFWSVNKLNNKTWPVTSHDVEDTVERPYFRECSVPGVGDVVVTRQGRTHQASWNYVAGCVEDISVDYYRLCWGVEVPWYLYAAYGRQVATFCQHVEGQLSTASFEAPWTIPWPKSVTLQSVEIRPNDIDYGGPLGSTNLLGSKALEPVFRGAYYPRQVLGLTVSNG